MPTAEQEVREWRRFYRLAPIKLGWVTRRFAAYMYLCLYISISIYMYVYVRLYAWLDHKNQLNKSEIRRVPAARSVGLLVRIIKKPTIGAWRDYQHGPAPIL